MHKIAESTSFASSFFVLAASGFSEVRDWRELRHEHPSFVGLGLHGFERFCSIFFVAELHVHVTIHVFCFVGAHVHAFHLTMLGHFAIDVFVEVVEMILSFHWIHVVSPSERMDVHVGNQQGRTDGRSIVLPRAPLSMPVAPPRASRVREPTSARSSRRFAAPRPSARPRAPASSDLEVERAVHAVLLRAEDRGQVLRHRFCTPLDAHAHESAQTCDEDDEDDVAARARPRESFFSARGTRPRRRGSAE